MATAMVYGCVSGDRIAFSPPLIITEGKIEDMIDRVKRALDETMTSLVVA